MKKILAVLFVLVLLTSTVSLSSCRGNYFGMKSIFPEGYTGGFGGLNEANVPEYYWVETYDELVEAMNLLKSHGSTFGEAIITNYEGDLFDTKYCIAMTRWGGFAEYVKFGDNPFDRWAKEVAIISYAFLEDVTIDELVYSYVEDYDVIAINHGEHFNRYVDKGKPISLEDPSWEYFDQDNYYAIYYGEKLLLNPERSKKGEMLEISDEIMDAIMNNVVSIGFE